MKTLGIVKVVLLECHIGNWVRGCQELLWEAATFNEAFPDVSIPKSETSLHPRSI